MCKGREETVNRDMKAMTRTSIHRTHPQQRHHPPSASGSFHAERLERCATRCHWVSAQHKEFQVPCLGMAICKTVKVRSQIKFSTCPTGKVTKINLVWYMLGDHVSVLQPAVNPQVPSQLWGGQGHASSEKRLGPQRPVVTHLFKGAEIYFIVWHSFPNIALYRALQY